MFTVVLKNVMQKLKHAPHYKITLIRTGSTVGWCSICYLDITEGCAVLDVILLNEELLLIKFWTKQSAFFPIYTWWLHTWKLNVYKNHFFLPCGKEDGIRFEAQMIKSNSVRHSKSSVRHEMVLWIAQLSPALKNT